MSSASSNTTSGSRLPPVQDESAVPWKKIALAVAGVGAVVGAGCLFYSYVQYRRGAKSTSQRSSKSSSSSSSKLGKLDNSPTSSISSSSSSSSSSWSSNSSSFTPAPRPDDDGELRQIMNEQLVNMQEKAIIEDDDCLQTLFWLRDASKPVTEYEPETRKVAAQWLVLYHTVKAVKMTASDPSLRAGAAAATSEEIKEWHNEHVDDMKVAWNLLTDVPVENSNQSRELTLFKLDIAQRLRDVSKMTQVYEELKKMPKPSPEEVIATFMVAPMLGRWQDTVELGKKSQEFQSFQEFHQLALQRPDIPDYETLAKLAESRKTNAKEQDMAWDNYDVTHITTTLKSASGPGTQPISEENAKADERDLPAGTCSYHRMGAVVRMVSPSPVPIPLTGIASNDRMYLEGYAIISQGGALFKHRESFECVREPVEGSAESGVPQKHVWKGTFVIQQEPHIQDDTEIPSDIKIKLEFDCQLIMTKSDV